MLCVPRDMAVKMMINTFWDLVEYRIGHCRLFLTMTSTIADSLPPALYLTCSLFPHHFVVLESEMRFHGRRMEAV